MPSVWLVGLVGPTQDLSLIHISLVPEEWGPIACLETRAFEDLRLRGEDDIQFIFPWLPRFLGWVLSGKALDSRDLRGNFGRYALVYYI